MENETARKGTKAEARMKKFIQKTLHADGDFVENYVDSAGLIMAEAERKLRKEHGASLVSLYEKAKQSKWMQDDEAV